jgi:hypothetical protein
MSVENSDELPNSQPVDSVSKFYQFARQVASLKTTMAKFS